MDAWFAALEREAEWLHTATFRDYVDQTPPDGHVGLPSGSYQEMLEWSGGAFANFFLKYPEAQAMQQKMLRVSERLQTLDAASPAPDELTAARQSLYRAQCNCAYWHGVFGGLYLAHLRRSVYANLIDADARLDQAEAAGGACRPARDLREQDVDGDGRPEVVMTSCGMRVVVDPAEGGAVTEWCLSGARVNLLDTLSRRPEPYHQALRARRFQLALVPTRGRRWSGLVARRPSVSLLHELLGAKEDRLEESLAYDDHRRTAFLEYALEQAPTLAGLVRSAWGEHRLWSPGPWAVTSTGTDAQEGPVLTLERALSTGRLRKTVRMPADAPALECVLEMDGLEVPFIALEFNVALRDPAWMAPRELAAAQTLVWHDPDIGVTLRGAFDPAPRLLTFPVETVSESEEGMERTFQGLCVFCVWPGAAGVGQAGPSAWRVRWSVAS